MTGMMTSDDEGRLAQQIRRQWADAHGVTPGDVHVIAGDHCIVAWIDDVLSPAEQAMLQWQQGQHLLQRYTNQLLVTIRPALRSEVETAAGRQCVADSLWADPAGQRIMCVYQLALPTDEQTHSDR